MTADCREGGGSTELPLCDNPMVLRTAKKGPNAGASFWGCSKYPGLQGDTAGRGREGRMNGSKAVIRALGGMLLLAAWRSVFAQTGGLPAPSRTVFKCVVAGKTVYSDEPCPAAIRIDVQPTRGIGKTAGTDVQRERMTEATAGALKPLIGMTPQQFEAHRRRVYLSAAAKSECAALDSDLAQLQSRERLELADNRPVVQSELLVARKRYREIKC